MKEWSIDWHKQWALHSPYYKDGVVCIDLIKEKFVSPTAALRKDKIFLLPGAGFGDMSHPTTIMSFKLLGKYVKDKIVVDIGSGSGILSVAAAALGAKKVYGLDIEEQALSHANMNAQANGFNEEIFFSKPCELPKLSKNEKIVIVMNMISSEQEVAWASLPQLHHIKASIIVSGILHEQFNDYCQECHKRRWKVEKKLVKRGWVACVCDQEIKDEQ